MSDSTTPSFPQTRELKQPYFLLRAQGAASYVDDTYQKALFGPNEPMARFVVRARLQKASGAALRPGERTPERPTAIAYDLGGLDPASVRPLTRLSSAEFAALKLAVEDFERKATPQGGRPISEQKLRQDFRLPDPDKEADAYWVHGPAHDPKLLILWGCEAEVNSSIPMAALLERLQSRLMSAQDTAAAALSYLWQSGESLNQFVAQPEYGPGGQLTIVTVGGKRIAASSLKPMGKLAEGTVAAFTQAAQAWYASAHPGSTLPAYEKQLRTSLRLPSPKTSKAYYSCGEAPQGLVIVPTGKEPMAETLPLVADATLGIPAPEKDALGNHKTPNTVAAELVTPKSMVPLYAGIAAGVVVVGGLLTFLLLPKDKDAPEFEEVRTAAGAETVQIVFREGSPIDATTLRTPEELAYLADVKAGKTGLQEPERRITLTRQSGGRVEKVPVLDMSTAADPEDGRNQLIVLSVPPMKDQETYSLVVNGIADKHGNVLSETVSRSFTYADRTPPKLVDVQPEGSDDQKLVVSFDEPLARVIDKESFKLAGFDVVSATLSTEDNKSIVVTTKQAFTNGARYNLTVKGIADASERGNPSAETSLGFNYTDTAGPSIRTVSAKVSQVQLELEFNEPLAANSAAPIGNYQLVTKEGEKPLAVSGAELSGDKRRITLRTAAMSPGVEYTVHVKGLTDEAGNAVKTEGASKSFTFSGPFDNEAPLLSRVTLDENNQDLTLVLTEWVDDKIVTDPQNYTFSDPALKVASIKKSADQAHTYRVRLSAQLYRAGVDNYLTVKRLVDSAGNESTDLRSPPIRKKGGIVVEGTQFTSLLPDQASLSPDRKALTLIFQEAIDPSTVSADNLVFSPILDVVRVEAVANNPKALKISFDAAIAAGTYNLTISNFTVSRDGKTHQQKILRGAITLP